MRLENSLMRMTQTQRKENVYKLRRYMEREDISVYELERRCGIGASVIANIMKGTSIGYPQTWERISACTKQHYDFILKTQKKGAREKKKKIDSFIPEYVFTHLNRFGNTLISRKIMRKYDEDAIIKEMKRHGYHVEMHTTENDTHVIQMCC